MYITVDGSTTVHSNQTIWLCGDGIRRRGRRPRP